MTKQIIKLMVDALKESPVNCPPEEIVERIITAFVDNASCSDMDELCERWEQPRLGGEYIQ